MKRLPVALAGGGVAAAVYEFVAVATGEVPTITDLVMLLPLLARIAVIVAAVAATIDHFFLRRFL